MPYQVIRVWADGRTMDYGKRFNRTAAKDALHASLAEDERPFSKAENSYAMQIDKMQVGEEKKIYPAEEECGDYFLVRMVSSLRRKAEAEDPEFKVGSEVCVHGLVNYPEYNGRFGRVKSVTVEGEWAMFILEWANPAEGGIKLTDKFLLPARMGPNGMEVVKRRKVESDVVCDKIKLASDLFKDELISKEKYAAVMVKACTTLETVRFALENKCIPQELVVTVCKKLLAEGNVSLVQCAKLLWIYGVSFVTMEGGSCREKFLFFYGDMFGGEKETYAILAQVFETEYSPEDAENDRSMHGRICSILLNLSGDTEAKLRTFKFVRATLADTTQPLCDRVVSKFLVNQLKGTEREVLTQCKKFLGEELISEAQYGELADTLLAF